MRIPKRVTAFVKDNRRWLPTAALLTGFIWDAITLGRPDQLFDNAVLLFYLVLAGGGILLLNFHQERNRSAVPLWQLMVVQFSFGNLASALFILYGKSGTIVGNWPFLLLLIALILGNEFFHGKFQRLRFHIAMFYLMLFAYVVLIVPVLLRKVGDGIFILSSLLGVVAIALYLLLVRTMAPVRLYRNKKPIAVVVVAIFVGFNTLYFSNLIPPVPLSLRDVGIYHDVTRLEDGSYQVMYEKGKWYEPWKRSDKIFHYRRGDNAFCFSSVFAPARISTPIFHRWEFFSESADEWQTATRISFSIEGGRGEGFRGFSEKESLTSGKWRCSVETERGVLIGRRNFEMVRGESGELATGIR